MRDFVHAEPYVWTPIGGDEFNFATRFTPLMRSLKDVARIGKYMTSLDGILNHSY